MNNRHMNIVVAIPVYKKVIDVFEEKSLIQCLKVLSRYQICLFGPEGMDMSYYKSFFSKLGVPFKVETFAPSFFCGTKGYNQLLLSSNYYKRFEIFDYMLIYQLDAYVFRDELEEWCEKGYDYRHGLAMAIPVVTNDVMTMGSWCFKRKFYHKWEWKECIPSDEYKSFRRTRLISNGALCLVDGTHAYIKGHGNPIEVILRMNLFAWLNLVRLIIKELLIAYGRTYEDLINDLRIIEEALNNELSKLKSYDYQAWQTENNKNKEFNRALLLSGDNIDNVGNIVNDYIFSNNVNLNYKNFDEFENIFRNNGQLF